VVVAFVVEGGVLLSEAGWRVSVFVYGADCVVGRCCVVGRLWWCRLGRRRFSFTASETSGDGLFAGV